MTYVDLHHHSEYSSLDGLGTIQEHIRRCKELKMPAITITDHGNIRNWLPLARLTEEEGGIWPIFGCEVYVCRDMYRRGLTKEEVASISVGKSKKEIAEARKVLAKAEGIREARHLTLHAVTSEGVVNLQKIVSLGHTEGFYYKPRVDKRLLAKHASGIHATSGCIGGLLSKSFFDRDFERLVDDWEWCLRIFGDNFSVELQPHPIEEQAEWNLIAVKLSRRYGGKIVVANDSHYPHPDDSCAHDSLVCVSTGAKVVDCDRMRYVPHTFGLKSREAMIEAFARHHPDISLRDIEAGLERSLEIAEAARGCELPVSGKVILPATIESPDIQLKKEVLKGQKFRDCFGEEYEDRIKHELKVIRDLGFAPYFLIVQEVIDWARQQGILVGPGRGSAVGSLICYLLQITNLDPMKHGLLFERFLTPGRPDWPDIDVDFQDDRRGEVFQYVQDKYGKEHVAFIRTFGRMRGRTALADMARVHSVKGSIVEKVTSSIVEDASRVNPEGSSGTIERALEESEDLRKFNDLYPVVVEHAIRLEGTIRQVGVHPAGIVVSPRPLVEYVPLENHTKDEQAYPVTAYDMRDIERAGLIKFDFLGLKTLSIISKAIDLIKAKDPDAEVDFHEDMLLDTNVLDKFTEQDFLGIFQYDTGSMKQASKGVVFTSFEDITAMNALNRPGPAGAGMISVWRKRKRKKEWERGHESIEAITAETYGVIVYQEQILRILQEVAGFKPDKAGKLRKQISKSKGEDALRESEEAFFEGCMNNGLTFEEVSDIWDKIKTFGAYGFNKSHSAAYSAIAVWSQWLKVYYPAEFFCSLLNRTEDTADTGRLARAAETYGLDILSPCINRSKQEWVLYGRKLLAPVNLVKGVGEKASESIVDNAPYRSLPEMLTTVNRRAVHKGVLKALIKSGAMSDLIPCPETGLEDLESILKMVGKKGWVSRVMTWVAGQEPDDIHPDYALRLKLEVGCVLGAGVHPLDCLNDFIAHDLRQTFRPLNDLKDGCWFMGVVISRKVGSGPTGRWAQLVVEDHSRATMKIKLSGGNYQKFRHIVDEGTGALVAGCVSIYRGNAHPIHLTSLLTLETEYNSGELSIDPLERMYIKDKHPTFKVDPSELADSDHVVGLVLSVKRRADRNGNEYAIISYDTGDDYVGTGFCFNEDWKIAPKSEITAGVLIEFQEKVDKKGFTTVKGIELVKP